MIALVTGPQDASQDDITDSGLFAILTFKWNSDVLATFESGSVDVRNDPEKFLKILDFYQAETCEPIEVFF